MSYFTIHLTSPFMMMIEAFAVLLLISGSSFGGEVHALIVGHNEGLATEPELKYAESDAKHVADTLVEVGAVMKSNLKTLLGTGLPTITKAFADTARTAVADDTLIVFLSAHGDHGGLHLAGEVWSWTKIRKAITAISPKTAVVFIDACQSGAFVSSKGFLKVPRIKVTTAPLGPRGRVMITSSGASELSHESAMLKSSPFAHYLTSGLRGAADGNTDGRITVGEIYLHIYSRVLAKTINAPAGPQHAVWERNLKGSGEITLVNLALHRAKLFIGSITWKSCLILDNHKQRVIAELRPGTNVGLPLPPAKYVIKCLDGEQVQVAHVELSTSNIHFDRLHFNTEPLTLALVKGADRVWLHRLYISAGVLDQREEPVWPAISAGFHSGPKEGGFEVRITSAFGHFRENRPTHGWLLATLGLDAQIPWWKVLGSTFEIGIEAGMKAHFVGYKSDALFVAIGPYSTLCWRPANRLLLALRLDLLTGIPLSDQEEYSFAILLFAGVGLEL